MIRVGLTGGIGSGKTTVAKVFETLGIPVYYADDRAKFIMNSDAGLRSRIAATFGQESYIKGQLNRAHLAAQVFNNAEQLALLNSIVHPVTIADAETWMQQQQTPYAVKEAALIFEAGVYKHLDYVIGVTAPEEMRIARVMQRDNIPADKVKERMSKQMDDSKKMKLCDFVIYNDETQLVIPQLLEVHEKLLALSGKVDDY
ncbi:MAG: dephospho-CoA kinase [Chitinophagaceae bacterium]|nr:MAG: dephospho-CoA kinase [Chitinophagaceae bacterium]